LLDAPCTASGIVRRHPDVRWLRRPDDVVALSGMQRELLDALWPLLKPGGRLLYATCSIFKREGQHQTDAFLQRHAADMPRLDPASPSHLSGLPDNASRPGPVPETSGDGFFYALIHQP
jgi:16S rRNA (cytosine967-C5)-methyltransferase